MTDKRKGKKSNTTQSHMHAQTPTRKLQTHPYTTTQIQTWRKLCTVFKKSDDIFDDTFVFPHISHSFRTNFMKLSANIRK